MTIKRLVQKYLVFNKKVNNREFNLGRDHCDQMTVQHYVLNQKGSRNLQRQKRLSETQDFKIVVHQLNVSREQWTKIQRIWQEQSKELEIWVMEKLSQTKACREEDLLVEEDRGRRVMGLGRKILSLKVEQLHQIPTMDLQGVLSRRK